MNGTRLGLYHLMEKYGLTKGKKEAVSAHQSLLCGAVSGAFGSFTASPFYLVIGKQLTRKEVFLVLKTSN